MHLKFKRVPDLFVSELVGHNTVMKAAEALSRVYDFDEHPYFLWIRDPLTELEEVRASQIPYSHCVEHFSRSLTAVLARIPGMERRLTTVYPNVAEEHGYRELERTHVHTYLDYLRALGVSEDKLNSEAPIRMVSPFEALLAFCLTHSAEEGAAALGIVEYTHIKISDIIARNVEERFWGDIDAQAHYQTHRELDVEHARDLFEVSEAAWDHEKGRERVAYAMALGAHYWWSLFNDMCPLEAIEVVAATVDHHGMVNIHSRRRHDRIPCELAVDLRIGDGPAQSVVGCAINEYGLLLRGVESAAIDTSVEVAIAFPGRQEPMTLAGRVRIANQHEGANQLGVEFFCADERQRDTLIRLVGTVPGAG